MARSRALVVAAVATVAISLLMLAVLLVARPVRGADETVSMIDNQFQPADITITVGDTVTWVNNGANPHTATSDDNGDTFHSGTVAPNGSFSFTFETAGTFPYHCEFHPGMTGTITVQAAAEPTPTPAPTPAAPAPTATPSPGMPGAGSPAPTDVPPVTSVLDRWHGSTAALVAAAAVAIVSMGGLLVARRRTRRAWTE